MKTEEKALALVNEIERERGEDELTPRIMRGLIMDEALCRAIERHEAFKQKVSDVVEFWVNPKHPSNKELVKFIIPKPKPDPLAEVMEKMGWYNAPNATDVENFRAALAARGLEIREKNDDRH